MPHIVGEYTLTINLDGKNHILKDKMKLTEGWGNGYTIQFFIKGTPSLSNFLKIRKKDVFYLINHHWNRTEYRMLHNKYDYGTPNNKIFHIIFTINSLCEKSKLSFNHGSNTNRTLMSYYSTDMQDILNWEKLMKKREISILKFNKKTQECIKCGFIRLEVKLDKLKMLASVI